MLLLSLLASPNNGITPSERLGFGTVGVPKKLLEKSRGSLEVSGSLNEDFGVSTSNTAPCEELADSSCNEGSEIKVKNLIKSKQSFQR